MSGNIIKGSISEVGIITSGKSFLYSVTYVVVHLKTQHKAN